MSNSVGCAALFIAALASGQGKMTVVVSVVRYYQYLGRNVWVFKTGPEFIDLMIHERISNAPFNQLEFWLVREKQSEQLLFVVVPEVELIFSARLQKRTGGL